MRLVILGVVAFVAGYLIDARLSDRTPIKPGEILFYWVPGVRGGGPDEPQAAHLLEGYLSSQDVEALKQADALFERVLPTREVGSEVEAMQWLTRYFLAAPPQREEMVKGNADGARLLAYYAVSNFDRLREILRQSYRDLGRAEKRMPASELLSEQEYLRFMSPRRASWENSDEVVRLCGLKSGDRVADIGAGPGFFSYRFAQAVGAEGRVYAIETNPLHLAFIRFVKEREKIPNLHLLRTAPEDIGLPADSLDCAFMCRIYHAIYGADSPAMRDFFMGSIRRALRAGGRLVIADNDPDVSGGPVFLGNRIAPVRVQRNVESYGFKLIGRYAPVPQRYVMVFEKR